MNNENVNYSNVHIEFLLEEPSMENVLKEILPQILPLEFKLDVNCFLRPHQGKSDLKKSIPKKIKTFSNFYKPAKIIIIHDQDSNSCIELKNSLFNLCNQHGNCPVLIRIACRELENWYLGDMNAVEKVYPTFKANNHKYKAKFRDTDRCHGAHELEKIIQEFQKGYASKEIPKYMTISSNKSTSFNQLITGIKAFLAT